MSRSPNPPKWFRRKTVKFARRSRLPANNLAPTLPRIEPRAAAKRASALFFVLRYCQAREGQRLRCCIAKSKVKNAENHCRNGSVRPSLRSTQPLATTGVYAAGYMHT